MMATKATIALIVAIAEKKKFSYRSDHRSDHMALPILFYTIYDRLQFYPCPRQLFMLESVQNCFPLKIFSPLLIVFLNFV